MLPTPFFCWCPPVRGLCLSKQARETTSSSVLCLPWPPGWLYLHLVTDFLRFSVSGSQGHCFLFCAGSGLDLAGAVTAVSSLRAAPGPLFCEHLPPQALHQTRPWGVIPPDGASCVPSPWPSTCSAFSVYQVSHTDAGITPIRRN